MEKWENLFQEDIDVPKVVQVKVDEAFALMKRESEDDMKKMEYEKKGKKWNRWFSMAVAASIVLLISSVSVCAARYIFGLQDVLTNLPKDARKHIVKNVSVNKKEAESAKTNEFDEKIKFTVKETLTDSNNCLVIIEASLKKTDDYLFVSLPDVGAEGSYANEFYPDAKDKESISEYAQRIGKKMVAVDAVLDESSNEKYNYNPHIEIQDHTHCVLILTVSSREDKIVEGTNISFTNKAFVYDKNSPDIWKQCMAEKTSVKVNGVVPEEESANYAFKKGKGMRIGNGPLILKELKVINTALETKVLFSCLDQKMDGWFSINLIDENGNIFDYGVTDGKVQEQDVKTGIYSNIETYKKMDLPDHVNVRVRDLDTDEIWELHDIPIVR